jgi:hypothetical protein
MMKSSTWIALIFCTVAIAAPAWTTADGRTHATQATAQTPFRLAAEDLHVMLKDLKYETAMTAEGQFEIEMKQGTYTFHPFVAVSTSGNKIWITTSVRQLAAADLANADLLRKLLIANSSIGPAQFYIENAAAEKKPADYHLGFGYPIDNRGVTEELLKDALDAFANNLVDEAAIWDNAKK